MVDTIQDLMIFFIVVAAIILGIMLLMRIISAGLQLTAAVLNGIAGVMDALFPQRSGPPRSHARFQASPPPPGILYHGTKTLEAALSILYDGWLVGALQAVYMTSDFTTASGYGEYIIEIKVSPHAGLTYMWGDIYTASLPQARAGTYCRISGVTPIRVVRAATGDHIAP